MAEDHNGMQHTIEPATSGRAKCRGCGETIARDEIRFGERVANAYGEGETTYWFHLVCGACKRPDEFLSVDNPRIPEDIGKFAAAGRAHYRLPRIRLVERARSGRARCRQCKTLIDAGTWRLPLEIWNEGRFGPMGFIHVACSAEYFGTADILSRLQVFNPGLAAAELCEVSALLSPENSA